MTYSKRTILLLGWLAVALLLASPFIPTLVLADDLKINFEAGGIDGSYAPVTADDPLGAIRQGMVFQTLPDSGVVVMYWFSYRPGVEPDVESRTPREWYLGTAPIPGPGEPNELLFDELFVGSFGCAFYNPGDPPIINVGPGNPCGLDDVGVALVVWDGCEQATFAFAINNAEGEDSQIADVYTISKLHERLNVSNPDYSPDNCAP